MLWTVQNPRPLQHLQLYLRKRHLLDTSSQHEVIPVDKRHHNGPQDPITVSLLFHIGINKTHMILLSSTPITTGGQHLPSPSKMSICPVRWRPWWASLRHTCALVMHSFCVHKTKCILLLKKQQQKQKCCFYMLVELIQRTDMSQI